MSQIKTHNTHFTLVVISLTPTVFKVAIRHFDEKYDGILDENTYKYFRQNEKASTFSKTFLATLCTEIILKSAV